MKKAAPSETAFKVPAPWVPERFTNAEANAIKMLVSGEASHDQQITAVEFIVRKICGYNDLGYYPDERDTAFALGKRFVATEIIKFARITAPMEEHA